MIKYSKDGLARYDSKCHTYHLGGKKLCGVTALISKYKAFFDAPKVAEDYVKKHGGDVQQLLAQWRKAGEDSCIAGTAVHDVFENFFLTGECKTSGLYQKELVAVKFIAEMFLTKRLQIVCVEEIVYDEALGAASMIDMVAKNDKEEYFIFDWKTSKGITKDSWGKMMAKPFDFLPDANFYHYSLQLKFYKTMYKAHLIKDCFIVHIGIENYKIIKAHEGKASLYTLLGMGGLA